LYFRHNVHSDSKNGWKAEVWTSGTVGRADSGLEVGIRIRSEQPEVNTPPRIKVLVRLLPSNGRIVEASSEPLLEEIAKDGDYWETDYEGDVNTPKKRITRKERTWETRVDAFQSDFKTKGRVRLPIGTHSLAAWITLEDGTTFRFEGLRLKIRSSRGSP